MKEEEEPAAEAEQVGAALGWGMWCAAASGAFLLWSGWIAAEG